MRANDTYRLGCPDQNGELQFSWHVYVTYSLEKNAGGPPPSPALFQQSMNIVNHIPVKYAFKVFIMCLNQEKGKLFIIIYYGFDFYVKNLHFIPDWDVLNLVLMQLPHVLENKALILTKQGNKEMHLLMDALYNMVTYISVFYSYNGLIHKLNGKTYRT